MKARSDAGKAARVLSVFAVLCWAASPLQAEPSGAVDERLARIEKQLAALQEGQREILEYQKTLSEEHTQLRHWVHKR